MIQQFARHTSELVQKRATTKAVKEEINIVDDVKVRAMKLPERFDENNKPKPYTDADTNADAYTDTNTDANADTDADAYA